MDQVRREAAENRDSEAEELAQKEIREIKSTASSKLSEGLSHERTQHLKNLKKEEEEREDFVKKYQQMKEEEGRKHREKLAQKLAQADERVNDAGSKCDVVTQMALDKLMDASLQLNEEIVEANAQNAVIEVDVTRRCFDEVDAQKDKDEFLSERRSEELIKQHAAIQKEEEAVSSAERAQRKENATLTLTEIRSDLKEQQKVGMFNLAIQQSADDRKNRARINAKIMEVKNLLEELDRWFMKISGVVDAEPKIYEKLKANNRIATRKYLGRFSEILSSISTKLSEVEQNLASFELKDVEMDDVIRAIKTKISSFGQVIAYLKLILGLDGVMIDSEKAKEFARSKIELFHSINKMDLVPENRVVIQTKIQQRQEGTMPNVDVQAIEN
ncbi:Protein CBG18530 [Caenorhabditis briggsae]|uniref:Uncharacterized protein n=2 Tax=Caenorhabditis briggsae TaxID=6238 RepID=A0AAE8ZW12_CAEBR|nr:Protein CBG18530 [Caenorhabditis briggsae]ULT86334.1 hypothetical protein L3Y34_006185 [Caenorhabditis briggsae]CAP35960.2 Protein CBG18530 [Caenorhabditis briggsae]